MTPQQAPATFRGSTFIEGEPWFAYIRVSTWKEEKISPELQRSAIEAWAARTGRRIIDWVEDLDATGRNFNRKIMGLIERVERGEGRGVAVWAYSRFGRNRTGNAINLARLEARGGQLESATEQVDATTAIGRFQRGLMLELAAFESDRIGENWKDTHAHRRALGLPAVGRPRFGYVWHPRRVPDSAAPTGWRMQEERYEPHPDYGEVAAELYERKLDHEGFATLAMWLNDELGLRTSLGNRWAPNTVQRYLDSGFAAGLLRLHDPKCGCGYGKQVFDRCREERIIYQAGAHPGLITPAQWEEYQAHRADVRKRPPRARRATYAHTGLIRHAECRGFGAARTGRVPGTGGQFANGWAFVCGARRAKGKGECEQGLYVRRDEVERETLDWLRREVADDVDTATGIPVQRTAPTDPRAALTTDRARTQAELKTVEDGLDRLVMDYTLNPQKYPSDSYARVRDELTKQKVKITKYLQSLAAVEEMPTRAEFRPLIVGLLAEWETISPVEQNTFLRQVLRRVVISSRKSDTGARWKVVRSYAFHPMWEPDPWTESES
ncbi:recombinase family protein [Streptomyces sp. NPDC026589]|uniref:recombinase family protein n=1 Tax=Streptomyces sp. NPDC026589 TaxID=3155609 RepID=UPI0033CC2365